MSNQIVFQLWICKIQYLKSWKLEKYVYHKKLLSNASIDQGQSLLTSLSKAIFALMASSRVSSIYFFLPIISYAFP